MAYPYTFIVVWIKACRIHSCWTFIGAPVSSSHERYVYQNRCQPRRSMSIFLRAGKRTSRGNTDECISPRMFSSVEKHRLNCSPSRSAYRRRIFPKTGEILNVFWRTVHFDFAVTPNAPIRKKYLPTPAASFMLSSIE
jgi:hypothetical protein